MAAVAPLCLNPPAMQPRFLSAAQQRQTAFSVEEMAPGGTERPDNGAVRAADLQRAEAQLHARLDRAPSEAEARALARVEELSSILVSSRARALIYVGPREYALPSHLRAVAIELDFTLGDQDGEVSPGDLREARRRYQKIRGPVGWNRLLSVDELERRLYPERTVQQISGLCLKLSDWWTEGSDPAERLRELIPLLEDEALARSYAHVAARRATLAAEDPEEQAVCDQALALMGQQICARGSVRPSITDVARLGAEDPQLAQLLQTPIDMARRLRPALLLEPYLGS